MGLYVCGRSRNRSWCSTDGVSRPVWFAVERRPWVPQMLYILILPSKFWLSTLMWYEQSPRFDILYWSDCWCICTQFSYKRSQAFICKFGVLLLTRIVMRLWLQLSALQHGFDHHTLLLSIKSWEDCLGTDLQFDLQPTLRGWSREEWQMWEPQAVRHYRPRMGVLQ